ncbi:GGDEF domain-containing protein [Marinomonas sp. TW1]|uniref:GGDEF domain-containing protein n=1 Tax=Marinomonas sp. TW1 TaxID=1561203 RepID=UPI0007AFD644|nr:GGDEF domain-containing protein [Marinomonas sp. TW1]
MFWTDYKVSHLPPLMTQKWDDIHTPTQLIRSMFILLSLLASAILIFSTLTIYWVSKAYILDRAEAEAISISQSFTNSYHELLLANENAMIDLSNIPEDSLDIAFRQTLEPFHMIKVKVFTPEKTIAYSTDKKLIGTLNIGNDSLEKALTGVPVSKMYYKDSEMDLAFEKQFNIDVVSTYTAIYNQSGQIAGAIEIYQNVTRFRDDMNTAMLTGTLIVLANLLIIFFIAYRLMKLPLSALKIAHNKLQSMATKDGLTQINNRTQTLSFFDKEIDRLNQFGGKLSVILMDLDKFKLINDTYGHPAGDEVLKQSAKAIRASLRQGDCVGRYGGEEFIVILPHANEKQAFDVAERIRTAIQNLKIVYDDKTISVSISAGITEVFTTEEDPDDFIKQADHALYDAKAKGRNCCIRSSQLQDD